MDRKLKTLLVCAAVMAVLLGIFFFVTGGGGETAEEDSIYGPGNIMPELDDEVILTSRDPADMVRLTLTNPHGVFTLLPTEGSTADNWNFYVAEEPDLKINQSLVNSLPANVSRFIVLRRLTDNPEDLKQYGLDDPATAVAEYSDGTTETILMGGQSADKNYYYCTVAGDPAVYLVATFTGNRYYYNYNDFLDKSLPSLDLNGITGLRIDQKGKAPFEIAVGYPGGAENVTAITEDFVMASPYEGAAIYTENLYSEVFTALRGLAIDGMEELYYKDLSAYGLDDPSLSITVTSPGETHRYTFGSHVDEEIYFTYDDDPHIYRVLAEDTSLFYDIPAFDYLEKFVHLADINYVTDIFITTPEKEYTINLNHYEGETAHSYPIAPEINGIEVDQGTFRTAYQGFIGITYDSAIEPGGGYNSLPSYQTTIMMTVPEDKVNPDAPGLNSGVYDPDMEAYHYEISVNYYRYNDNFYAVSRDGAAPDFAVSNRRLATMISAFDDLITE